VELAAKYRVEQEPLLKSIKLGFVTLGATTDKNDEGEDDEDKDANKDESIQKKKKKKQRKKATAVELKNCIPSLIGISSSSSETHGERIHIEVEGSRAVHHLLRFSPRLCDDVLKGILEELSTDHVLALAKDGLGSRCIIDGILDGPTKTPVFIAAVKQLREKLSGHWTSLASDRVGQHAVKKLFIALPKIDDKSKLVEELVAGGNRLRGNAMGRSVLHACLVDEYRENRKVWREKVAKQMKFENAADEKESFLAEAIPTLVSASKNDGGGDEDDGGVDNNKKKRKRRRKKSTNNDEEDGEKEEHGEKLSKASKTGMSVDSIMNVLNV
jgi:hypothetical protein